MLTIYDSTASSGPLVQKLIASGKVFEVQSLDEASFYARFPGKSSPVIVDDARVVTLEEVINNKPLLVE